MAKQAADIDKRRDTVRDQTRFQHYVFMYLQYTIPRFTLKKFSTEKVFCRVWNWVFVKLPLLLFNQ